MRLMLEVHHTSTCLPFPPFPFPFFLPSLLSIPIHFLAFYYNPSIITMTHSAKINLAHIKEQSHRRRKQQLFRHRSQGQMFIDMSNLWKSSSQQEQRLFAAVKKSDLFSGDRMDTFIKFNYRTMENKDMNYHTAFQKILSPRNKLKPEKMSLRGTMNVSELWSEKNLQDVLGSLPYPKDRLKVLHSYEKNNAFKIKLMRKKQMLREGYRI